MLIHNDNSNDVNVMLNVRIIKIMILITTIIKAIIIHTSNDNDDGNNDDNDKKMIIVLKTVIKNDSEKGRGKKGKLHKIS